MGDASGGRGLHLYTSDDASSLVDRLADVLAADPLDPMASEWLAVPSDGMRRWVLLELARRLGESAPGAGDGVAANFTRAYPGTLRTAVLDAASDGDDTDPWRIDRMVWPLLAVFDDLAGRGDMSEFTRLPDGASRFTRVRVVADLFDRYHLHRPEMVRGWAEGRGRPEEDAAGPSVVRWQRALWTLLRQEIGRPSPPERTEDVLRDVASGSLELDLPERLVFFGSTTLPGPEFLPLVEAVANRRAVHLFLLTPHRFDPSLLADRWPAPADDRHRLRADDPNAATVRNPLLRSWGRLPRETALLLADDASTRRLPLDWSAAPPSGRDTLLARLQAGIRADHPAPGSPTAVPADDRSVRFHACYGAMRQVQVARDAILHLLQDDPTLREEDVLVVTPDLPRFAPLVEAAFGPAGDVDHDDPGGPPVLRYRIADQSLRSSDPLLGAVMAFLDLVAGRCEVAGVLDLLSTAPVRERFGLDDDDLGVLAEWATEGRVRWGLDPGHRAAHGLAGGVVANTWQAALDRLLLGSAVADGELDLAVGGVAPFGVDAGDVELLGVLAHVLERAARWAELAAGARFGVAGWVDLLLDTCRALFAVPDRARWQFDVLERILRDVAEAAAASRHGSEVTLDLLDVRRLLERRMVDGPGRPDFFRGGVTVTSTTSLRWVPFRVVCVLGLDRDAQGAATPDAADLVASAPRPGDPDPAFGGEAVVARGGAGRGRPPRGRPRRP